MARKSKAQIAAESLKVQEMAVAISLSLDETGTAYAPVTTILERRAIAFAVRYLQVVVTDFNANYVTLGNRQETA